MSESFVKEMKKEIELSTKIRDLNERINDKESEIERSKIYHTNMIGEIKTNYEYLKKKYENILKEKEERHQRVIMKKTQVIQGLKDKLAEKVKERDELLERTGI